MISQKRSKPFYKQFLKLRINVQNRIKLFKFKKKKWNNFQFFALKQLKFFKRYKIRNQLKNYVPKFLSKGNSFQNNYRKSLQTQKVFNLFYGALHKKYLKVLRKKVIKSSLSSKFKDFNVDYRLSFLQNLESRLDVILYRSGFCYSIKNARQCILHKHFLVNGKSISSHSYAVKTLDLIEVKPSLKSINLVRAHLRTFNFWPTPPKSLIINYKTLQIFYLKEDLSNYKPVFNHYLNVNRVISDLKVK